MWRPNVMILDRDGFARLANWLAVALAASLPWSTSLTGIFAALWLIAFAPTCDLAALRRLVRTPAAFLPLMFLALGAFGMLWADVTWDQRFGGLSSFYKFLYIPLLLHFFSRLGDARAVLIGFLASCTVLLAVSWTLLAWPGLLKSGAMISAGVPVKDYIAQGAMFTFCMAIVLYFAVQAWRDKQRGWALILAAVATLFVANIFYVATSRTSLVLIPILLVLFGYRQFGWKGIIASLAIFLLLLTAAWPSAGYLRTRVTTLVHEIQSYNPDGRATPAGERLVFWTKSVGFIADAPVIGHGTGSIRDQFERSTAGRTGMAAEASANPHNQILAVGIQLGFAGIALLLAMWLSHLMLFRVGGLAGWVGLVVATQNVIGSQFNSHLFDFTHGWAYVIGIGIAGGVALRQSARAA
jgi:O-antigen ligase